MVGQTNWSSLNENRHYFTLYNFDRCFSSFVSLSLCISQTSSEKLYLVIILNDTMNLFVCYFHYKCLLIQDKAIDRWGTLETEIVTYRYVLLNTVFTKKAHA